MNTSNVFVLTLVITGGLFFIQRTQRRYLWIVVLVFVVVVGGLIYRWAIYKNQVTEALVALGISAALNFAYWLLIGRRHPPGADDEIEVAGMDD